MSCHVTQRNENGLGRKLRGAVGKNGGGGQRPTKRWSPQGWRWGGKRASSGKQQLDEEHVWRYSNERLITIFPKFLPVNKMILRNMV